MKSIRNIFFVTPVLFCLSTKAQNVYDTYNPIVDSIVTTYGEDSNYYAFTGEYQIFSNLLESWEAASSLGYSISYKIEPVSFPFTPDCSNGDCGNSSSSTRDLVLIGSYVYGDYNFHRALDTMSSYSTLLSNKFTNTAPPGGMRDFIPHTVLKHTLFLHFGASVNSPVVDSFVFLLDHTRGFMSEYPFRNDNDESDPAEHDVTIFPWFIYTHNDSFLTVPNQGTNFMNTVDYFPFPDAHYFPDSLIPAWLMVPQPNTPNIYLAPEYFLHPSPYSLVGVLVANYAWDPFAGLQSQVVMGHAPHTYYIDTAMDLTTINPRERIIYNPSAVYITAADPIVFPSGYTFMTVGGKYPTKIQVEAIDSDTMYADLREVPVIGAALNLTDNPNTTAVDSMSYYYVTAGCTLRIEPCVTIYDATIVVQTGGRIELDTNGVGGNYILLVDSGGVLVQQNSNPSVPCSYMCFESSHYNQRHVTISSNTTWDTTNVESAFPGSAMWSAATNNTVKFVEGITIDSGITLTIGAGVNLLFGPNGKVIVKKGGRLIVNGTATDSCLFGPACQLEWNGIEVWGDSAITQFVGTGYTLQGYLDMDYCVVEHARTAVTLGKPGTLENNGGVIKAYHCSFLNNVHDVVFQPYRNFVNTGPYYPTAYNISLLSASEFRTTEYFFDASLNLDVDDGPSSASSHIVPDGVKVRHIASCTFANDTPNNYAPHLRGTGISGFESGLLLQSQNPNRFEGLSDGVWMKGVGTSAYAMNLSAQTFKNNIHAIVCEGTRFSAILADTIDVPESPQYGYDSLDLELGYDKPVGVFMIGSIDYRIEDNQFNVGDTTTQITPMASCKDCSYNIVIYNTAWPTPANTGNGTIYNNNIHHASIGIQAQGNNGVGGFGNDGAEFICNDFEESEFFDFLLIGRGWMPSAPAVQSTIRDQGNCDPNAPHLKATNYYDGCDFPSDSQAHYFYATSSSFVYNDLSVTSPACHNIGLVYCNPLENPNPCGSHLTGLYWAPILTKYNTATTAHENARHLLDSLVDGGSTEDALDLIKDKSGSDLYDELEKLSPWLSDIVLLDLLEEHNRSKLNEEQLVAILLLNGRLSQVVYDAAINTSPELAGASIDALTANQENIGARELKEREWHTMLFEADKEATVIVEYALSSDSIVEGANALRHAEPIPEMQKLFTLQLAACRFDAARGTLDSIFIKQGNVETFWTVLASISIVQAEENRSWSSATIEEIQVADSIWGEYGEEFIGARVAVSRYTKQGFLRSPFDLESSSERRANPDSDAPLLTQSTTMNVFPNPATHSATITINGASNLTGYLEVVNSVGQTVNRISLAQGSQITINLDEYPSGILYLRLVSEGECLDTEKLIIMR